jgi:chemotaxis protein MotB
MAGKGGGAWKVAYADFTTAMMAFFLVMWIIAQSKAVKEAVARYFQDPFGSSATPSDKPHAGGKPPEPKGGLGLLNSGSSLGVLPKGNNLQGPGRGAEENTGKKSRLAAGKAFGPRKPSLIAIHDGNRQMEGTVITFAADSAELDEEAKEKLKRLIPSLLGKRYKIEIRGHAMRRPLPPDSPYADAWQLSYARCVATMKFLEQQGVDPELIRLSQAGVYEPFTLRLEPEKQALNARVELYVLSEFADDLMGTEEERAERIAPH